MPICPLPLFLIQNTPFSFLGLPSKLTTVFVIGAHCLRQHVLLLSKSLLQEETMQSQRSIFLCSYLCFHPLPPLSAAIQANESCSGQQQLNEWSAAIQTVIDALGVRCFSLFSFPSFLPGFLLSCLHVFLLFVLFFNSLSLLIATSSKLGCSCLPLMVGKRSRALPLIFKDCV